MGNIIATISWTPTNNDHAIIQQLRNLAIDHGLSPDCTNFDTLDETMSHYSADISGIYLAIGRKAQADKVKNYCAASVELLEKMHITCQSRVEDLAL